MEKITYTKAYEELQEIISRMENGQMSVDELSENIKKATTLIGICKQKLKNIEVDVNKLILDIESKFA